MVDEIWSAAIAMLHPEVQKHLAALAELGLWGGTPGKVIETILLQALRETELDTAARMVAGVRAVESELGRGYPVRGGWRLNDDRGLKRKPWIGRTKGG